MGSLPYTQKQDLHRKVHRIHSNSTNLQLNNQNTDEMYKHHSFKNPLHVEGLLTTMKPIILLFLLFLAINQISADSCVFGRSACIGVCKFKVSNTLLLWLCFHVFKYCFTIKDILPGIPKWLLQTRKMESNVCLHIF